MLINEGYDVAAVITQPDRPKGRGGKTAPPAVKIIAAEAGVPVYQPEKPADIYDEINALGADLCVTAAYGKILKKRFLRVARYGAVNVHASLLPLYRGASPIHQALLRGDRSTGVTTMLMDAGIDTGAILMSEQIPIPAGMYFQELHDRLSGLGACLLKKTIPALVSGALEPTPQDDTKATYAPVIQKSDGELDFSLDAESLVNRIRAFSVWPGALARIGGKTVRIHRAVAGYGEPGAITGAGAFAGQAGAAAVVNAGTIAAAGAVAAVGRGALSIACGGGGLLNVTRLQFENGRAMDISECWHNLKSLL